MSLPYLVVAVLSVALVFSLYLFIWYSSFWILDLIFRAFLLSILSPLFFWSLFCVSLLSCTSWSKGLFLLLTTWMACSFDLLLQNIFMESGLSSALSTVTVAGMLCYTYLMPLSHEVNWVVDTFLDTLWCWVWFFFFFWPLSMIWHFCVSRNSKQFLADENIKRCIILHRLCSKALKEVR